VIRGAVYQIDLGQARRGHEQRGRRYGVLLSPSDSPLSVVTVAPTSTSAQPALHRPIVHFDGTPTRVLVDQLRTIDIFYVGEVVGYLTRDEMLDVENATARYLGIIPQLAG